MDLHAAFALSCGQSDPILRWDLERRPIPTILELPVEVVQQVAHELMGVLLLIASGHTKTNLNYTLQ